MNDTELRGQLERHHADCYGWALSCCSGGGVEAEDVLQTSYLKVLDGRAKFKGESSFKTWLFSVIRRTAMDERRRRWLRFLGFSKYTREKELEGEAEPVNDGPLSQPELLSEFRGALDQLPRRQKEVLHLVFYQDLTLQEASSVMGVTVGSARSHYERGKQSLRKWLKIMEDVL